MCALHFFFVFSKIQYIYVQLLALCAFFPLILLLLICHCCCCSLALTRAFNRVKQYTEHLTKMQFKHKKNMKMHLYESICSERMKNVVECDVINRFCCPNEREEDTVSLLSEHLIEIDRIYIKRERREDST